MLALFLRPTVGVQQKMILRMSGDGALAIFARHDDGTQIEPNHIDGGHIASSYDPLFPGTNEWGVFFTFAREGCWRIHAQRTNAAADFYVVVTVT